MAQYAEMTSGVRSAATLDYRARFDGGAWMWLGVSAYAVPVKERWLAPTNRNARVIGFMKNVTEKRHLEDEKRVLEERLRHSAKMEAIGRLAGGVAHDFNNILGGIVGYAEMAQGELAMGSDVRRYVDTIASAGERGKALVAQILAFSGVNSADVHPVDMKALVTEVMSALKGALPANVRITESASKGALYVLGNGTHLYQLVMNVTANAIQAMPSGGELRISMSATDNACERMLQGGLLTSGRFVTLEFEDDGIGIAEAVLARIFEPFFSTKTREKGTGLGLAIAHGVVLKHGGAIDVQSIPGKGSRFTVYLPEHAGHVAGETGLQKVIPVGNGETILVVDDEVAIVGLAEDILAQLGYEPLGFTSSREALAAYMAEPERFDAVLTDEVMPEMTGTELSAKLREASATLPILIASGYGGPDFDSRARAAGASMIMKKPFLKAELATAIAAVLANQYKELRNVSA
jgi:signal transduction histidine kinase/CheY-like chemotaxis protein